MHEAAELCQLCPASPRDIPRSWPELLPCQTRWCGVRFWVQSISAPESAEFSRNSQEGAGLEGKGSPGVGMQRVGMGSGPRGSSSCTGNGTGSVGTTEGSRDSLEKNSGELLEPTGIQRRLGMSCWVKSGGGRDVSAAWEGKLNCLASKWGCFFLPQVRGGTPGNSCPALISECGQESVISAQADNSS